VRHRLHALCPYFAMFPETFAEGWIDRLTVPGDTVLDPFSGRGTTPFQAVLMGREAIATDVNPVAYCLTKAKTRAPHRTSVQRRIRKLESAFTASEWECSRTQLPAFFKTAYRPSTLRQLLYLRDRLRWAESRVDCMIAALVLGSLHGESQRSQHYLSNQMPRTISTKPAYSLRFWLRHSFVAPEQDVFELLRGRLRYRYETPPPRGKASVLNIDMRDLARVKSLGSASIKCVITSPPYLDTTNFEEDQWLRLWFLGGPPHPTRNRVSRDDRYYDQNGYWRLIADMWRMLGLVVAPRGHVVLRIGVKGLDPERVVGALTGTAVVSQRRLKLVSHSVSETGRRQTDAFRPGSPGTLRELDAHYRFQD
jgi:hypothetical protein